VFGVENGSEEEKANAFIEKLAASIPSIGPPLKGSDWPGAIVGAGDVAKVTKLVLDSIGGRPFGWKKLVTADVVRFILSRVIASETPPAPADRAQSRC
jgi:hypothetical protein